MVKAVALALLLCACATQQRPECGEARLAIIVAYCRSRVELECAAVQDIETCPAVVDCDRLVSEWEKCE
jgi:hypothetical protein